MSEEAQMSLIEVDWGAQWMRERSQYHHDDSAEYWDKRAPKFGTKRGVSPYRVAFIEKLNLDEGDTVFDMGCGNGGIAIPLAQAGYKVIARDFSSGMLAELAREIEATGVTGIDFAQMSWEDNWEACGIEPGMVDVAFASRSVITADLKASLQKLSRVARKRACVTVSTSASPRVSVDILKSLGASHMIARELVYTFNILIQLGYNPTVSYIESKSFDAYDSREDALTSLQRMIELAQGHLSKKDAELVQENLPTWLENNLVPNENSGLLNSHNEIEGPWRLAIPHEVRWAFVSWEV